MAEETRLSITLKAESLIDELDKAAAQFEIFSKKAEDAIKLVEGHTNDMSKAQKRAYDVIKKSYDDHAAAMKKLGDEYEALRAKQKSGAELTEAECNRLQALTKEYKNHSSAMRSSMKNLGQFGKECLNFNDKLGVTTGSIKFFSSMLSGAAAIGLAKLGSLAMDTARDIVDLGLQAQQIVSQLGAMKNNLAGGAMAYQAFNDVARNTNYDFAAVYNMGKQLMNMGYSAKNAADLIQLCADTSAGLGQDVSGAQRLVEAISRIQTTGRVTREQLASLQMAGLDLDKAFAPLGLDAQTAMRQPLSAVLPSKMLYAREILRPRSIKLLFL